MINRRLATAAAGIVGCVSSSVLGQCWYTVEVFDGPGPGYTFVNDMNEAGQIVGSTSGDVGWYWTPSTGVVAMPFASGVVVSSARGINDILGPDGIGQITGELVSAGQGNGYVYDDSGLRLLMPTPPLVSALGNAINDSGWVAGRMWSPADTVAGLWIGDQVTGLRGEVETELADDMNVHGAIVGRTSQLTMAFIWDGGQFTIVKANPGAFAIQPSGMNDANQFVGRHVYLHTIGSRAVLWTGAELIELESWEADAETQAHDINNAGDIVGSTTLNSNEDRAVLWRNGVPFGLQTMLVGDSQTDLWDARVINDAGQIACFGFDHRVGAIVGARLTPMGNATPDLNSDGYIDTADLDTLLAAWGGPSAADLNCDGDTDSFDLALLLSQWSAR
ncbi:MAG: hypothetical protein KDA25_11245 [Phycisphaerales bacterium]|nr:hypothetical protein [Phycisphaerales bacterium]